VGNAVLLLTQLSLDAVFTNRRERPVWGNREIVNKTGQRVGEAELYRLKGELVLQSGVTRRKSKVKGQKSKMMTPNS
jgi:hypothetical protein